MLAVKLKEMKEFKKVLLVYAVAIVAFVMCAFAQVEEPFKLTWYAIVGIVLGLYEVIARIIPTVANWSWLAKIIDIIKWVSDFLNNRKEKKLVLKK